MSHTFLAAAVAVCCLGVCATPPEAASPSVGRLYTYVRSNQDGSMAEDIYVSSTPTKAMSSKRRFNEPNPYGLR